MRFLIFCALFTVTAALFADGSGVTSRVRVTADDSNRNWERAFYGDRLNGMAKNNETADELLTDTDAPAQDTPERPPHDKGKLVTGKRTVEYHIIQESSEEGKGSRKVNKRVIIEPIHPHAPTPKK